MMDDQTYLASQLFFLHRCGYLKTAKCFQIFYRNQAFLFFQITEKVQKQQKEGLKVQEGYFFQTIFDSSSPPAEQIISFCRDDQVCVESAIEGTNICHLDDGIPLYTFECGTITPKCIYGVASYYKSRTDEPGRICNDGSFFASVSNLYSWIWHTMMTY